MALKFIFGPSGAGKSYYIYNKIIQESMENPKKQYLILVPEQFTMQTQKDFVTMHPRKGIMNIDILSFERLAFRVLEELGVVCGELLEETGKSMVLRKVAQEKKKDLKLLGARMDKQGYVAQMKSMVSELRQYEITAQDLEEMLADFQGKPELYYKLRDIQILYQGFFEYLEGNFITQEEVLDVLGRVLGESEKVKNSIVVLDGYTGFTPIQLQLLEKLLTVSSQVYVTITMGQREDPYKMGNPHQLFYLSKQTAAHLRKLAEARQVQWSEIWITGKNNQGRFAQNPAMDYLEKNIFRYGRAAYSKEQQAVQVRECLNPGEEMEETAYLIRRMVRTQGYRYRDFAVITGDMEVYAPAAARAFARYEIPCFLDEKHSLFLNPFVEYIRASVDLVVENFSYESVFRLLRCGLTEIGQEEMDRLENYVIAMGIRGISAWQKEWEQNYRGQDPEECLAVNETRRRLLGLWEPFYRNMKEKKATLKDRAKALYAYICENHIQEKLRDYEARFQEEQNLALVKEYSQIYKIVMDLLDKMTEVLGDEQVRAREFKEILEAGLSEAKVGVVPPASDQVLVGDMERTRLKDIQVLFFVGVNEGKIPKEQQAGKILSDLNREEMKSSLEYRGLSLAPTSREALYTQKFYLYLNLTKPSKQVYLSYSRLSSSGEALTPSYLIAQVEKLFPTARKTAEEPRLPENYQGALDALTKYMREKAFTSPMFGELMFWFTRQEAGAAIVEHLMEAVYYRNPKDAIGRSVAEALYGTELENSATRLEQFAKCACSHFLTYGLALRERVRYEFSMADLGTLLHDSLDLFAKKVREQALSWGDLEEAKRDALAEACVEEAAEKAGQSILSSSARNAYTINRAKRMVKRSVWALQNQLLQGEFYPALTEWAFGAADDMDSLHFAFPSGGSMDLTGRIDRIDLCEEEGKLYVKVIDYKSGSTQLDFAKLYYGLQLQLALYLNAAIELEQKRFPDQEVKPAGIFYYNIKDPLLNEEEVKDAEEPQKEILKKLKMEGLASAEPEILRKLDRSLAAGRNVESLAIPVKYTSKGEFSSNSKVADEKQFEDMMKYVSYKAKQIGQEILEGNIEAKPYEKQKENACEYCPYGNVCGFDEKIPGYHYKRLPSFGTKEVWEKIREALEQEERKEKQHERFMDSGTAEGD